MMTITIEKKYLILPVNNHATRKKLCFYDTGSDGKLVMDLDCKIDPIQPEYYAYPDVSRFRGMTLQYDCIPHMAIDIRQTEEIAPEELFSESYRPMVHFTPRIGWINDPNGLIFYRGVYHMFYQYNPCGTEWGNMHWGHAVSRDLLHWEEKDNALFPDETGTMYSGSAIEDTRNVAELQSGELPTMLLYYTAAGGENLLSSGKAYTQCMAYSTDGGNTIVKYSGNPVLGTVAAYNRDPKVVWVEEIGKFLMVIYLAEDRYGMYTSENLLDWVPLQEIRIPNEAECPDLYRFRLGGKNHWVLIGASDKYIVGVFKDGKFVPQAQERNLCYSPCSYAGQSFSGVDGRVLRMTWGRLGMPCVRASNQMSIPMEMKLEADETGYCLTAYPMAELSQLYADAREISDRSLDIPLTLPLERAAYDIHILAEYKNNMTLELFGHRLRFDVQENCIIFGKIRIPISKNRETVDIRIIADRCSFEVFADHGRFYANLYAICDYNLPYLNLTTDEGAPMLRSLSCHRLHSIHEKMQNG